MGRRNGLEIAGFLIVAISWGGAVAMANPLNVHGYVQFDSRDFIDGAVSPAANTFLFRRIQPIVEGTVARYWDYRIMTNFAGGEAAYALGVLNGVANGASAATSPRAVTGRRRNFSSAAFSCRIDLN